MVTVTTLCIGLSVWYSVRTRHVISQLETASRRTLEKSAAVTVERKRSDRILNQLLPRSVVVQLKVKDGQHSQARVRGTRSKKKQWALVQLGYYSCCIAETLFVEAKARFPLPELTVRDDGWPVSTSRVDCWRLVNTASGNRAPVNTARVDPVSGGHPSSRAVNSGSGNRA